MRALGVVRKIDELGRVVIPVEVRRRFGIDVKDSVEIYIDDNDEGKLIVRYAIGELKDLLIKANENKRIKLELLNPKMKKVLNAS